MIIDHTHEAYRKKREQMGGGKYNGAFYYSKEIVKNIIPNIHTDRNWITILVPNVAVDHSIVFIHNNLYPQMYDYLKGYKDLILVCGIPSTCDKVKHLGTPIYLPLSIDTEYVRQFIRPKTKGTAYAGRKCKSNGIPKGTKLLPTLPRHRLLPLMAEYENIYAVGRTAIEAKVLGCNILPYDKRFPEDIWEVLDNKEVIPMLQAELDRIDQNAQTTKDNASGRHKALQEQPTPQ